MPPPGANVFSYVSGSRKGRENGNGYVYVVSPTQYSGALHLSLESLSYKPLADLEYIWGILLKCIAFPVSSATTELSAARPLCVFLPFRSVFLALCALTNPSFISSNPYSLGANSMPSRLSI